jgi:uncharacterized membrane protein
MTTENSDAAKAGRFSWLPVGISMTAVVLILALTPGAVNFEAWSQIRLRPPDLAPLLEHSLLVQAHVATVSLALVLGPVQFVLPKGTALHRTLGWSWSLAMFSTAVMTFFIRDMNNGAFSPIHLFSVMTLIGVPAAVWLARTGRIASHTRAMIGLYIGLVIAGVTAITPGRLIWDMFFS